MKLRLVCWVAIIILFSQTVHVGQSETIKFNRSIVKEFRYIEESNNVRLCGLLFMDESDIIMYGAAFEQPNVIPAYDPTVGVGWLQQRNLSTDHVTSTIFVQHPDTCIQCVLRLKDKLIIGVEKSSNSSEGFYLFDDDRNGLSNWNSLPGSIRAMTPTQNGMIALGVVSSDSEFIPQCILVDSNGISWTYLGDEEDRNLNNFTEFEAVTVFNNAYALLCKKGASFSIRFLDHKGRLYDKKPIVITGNPISFTAFSKGFLLGGQSVEQGSIVSFLQCLDADGGIQWQIKNLGIRLLSVVFSEESSIFAVGYGAQDDNLYMLEIDKEGNILSSVPITMITPATAQGTFENVCAVNDFDGNLGIGAVHRKPNCDPQAVLFRIVQR